MNSRILQVQKKLAEWQVNGLLVENKIDLFYLTGLSLSAGKLLITAQGAALVVDGRYEEIARRSTSLRVLLDSFESFRELIKPFSHLGFDGATLSWEAVKRLMQDFPKHHWKSIPSPLKTIRAIKDTGEIEKLKKAAKLGSEGFDYLKTLLKEGVVEKELAYKLDLFWKERGGKGLAFEPIIAFGENTALPHYHAGKGRLKKGDPILIDIGVVFEDYHSDMTRTLFFGDPSSKMKELYSIVHEAQKRALKEISPLKKVGEIDRAARHYIAEKGYGEAFTHSLGHGVGLEIHEWPFLRNKEPYAETPLQEGMCVTVEPGIYLPGTGGVRIEDTVLVTSSGYESLTQRSSDLETSIIS